VNLPLGYRYATAFAGIRKTDKDDVALIVSEKLASAAAVFTTNLVAAAPVRTAREHLKHSGGKVAAILINAGNANCATVSGDHVAAISCRAVAKALNTKTRYVLPASTGVIGVELDPKLITDAVPKLVSLLAPESFEAVANAILTTDTRVKVVYREVGLRKGPVRFAGLTKGSGMIHPHMATTLGFVCTDAALPAQTLREMLQIATGRSYNSLSVDGDMSTNDMVALLANGASGVKPRSGERELLQQTLNGLAEDLARQIAADGEGARKLITIRTSGLRTVEEARTVARAIANSPLVKTAIGGSDPNWGRIIAAAGYSGVIFDPTRVDIYLQDTLVCKNGLAADFDEAQLKLRLSAKEVGIRLTVKGKGTGEAQFFTCDLTEGYIAINGSYRT
jgi:glutamate N-acetyltransferase/amino-acid N-acetyltransferase